MDVIEKTPSVFVFGQPEYLINIFATAIGIDNKYVFYGDAPGTQQFKNDIVKNPQLEQVIIIGDSIDLIEEGLSSTLGHASNTTQAVIVTTASEIFIKDKLTENKFPHLKTCLDKKFIKIVKLPAKIEDIITQIKPADLDTKELNKESQQIAKELYDKQTAGQRHRLENVLAAARILNGAFGAGDFNLSNGRAEATYRKLLKFSFKLDDLCEDNADLKDALITIEKAKACNELLETAPVFPDWLSIFKKILVIDDEIAMWKPVWEFVFGNKVEIVATGKEGIERITDESNEYDCVLLDINLAKDDQNGLYYLQHIKNLQFELPVIMMTAFDDNEITRLAYLYGAQFCFVKERRDRSDRNSVAYYTMLKRVLLSTFTLNHPVRDICKSYREIENKHTTAEAIYQKCNEEIKKGVFCALLNTEEKIISELYSGITSEMQISRQAISHFYTAVEIHVNYLLSQMPNNQRSYCATANLGLKKYYLDELKKDIPSLAFLFQFGDCQHLNVEDSKYNIANAAKVFKDCYNWFNYFLQNVSNSKINSFEPVINTINLTQYRTEKYEYTLGHENRGRAGAARIVQGAYLKSGAENLLIRSEIKKDSVDEIINCYDTLNWNIYQCVEKKYTCLFIDDNAEDTGWKTALDLILPDVFINHIKYTCNTLLNDILKEAQNVDFVFLDLKLPYASPKNPPLSDPQSSEEIGIQILGSIKKNYPCLPIIVITATDDAYWYRQAVNHGAFECFPKTHEDLLSSDNPQYFIQYYDRFMEQIKKAKHYLDGELKLLNNSIAELLSLVNNNDSCLPDIFWPFNYFIPQKVFRSCISNSWDEIISMYYANRLKLVLKKCLFFCSADAFMTHEYRVQKLLLNSSFASESAKMHDAFLMIAEMVEFIFKSFIYLYLDDAIVIQKTTLGSLFNNKFLKEKGLTNSSGYNDYIKFIKNHGKKLLYVWNRRNDVKDKKKINVSAKDINKGIEALEILVKKINEVGNLKIENEIKPAKNHMQIMYAEYFFESIGYKKVASNINKLIASLNPGTPKQNDYFTLKARNILTTALEECISQITKEGNSLPVEPGAPILLNQYKEISKNKQDIDIKLQKELLLLNELKASISVIKTDQELQVQKASGQGLYSAILKINDKFKVKLAPLEQKHEEISKKIDELLVETEKLVSNISIFSTKQLLDEAFTWFNNMHESRKELHARKRALAAIKNMDFIPFNNFCAAVADVFNTSLRDTILGLPYALKNILGSNHPERELFKIVFLITGKKENEIRIEGRKFNNHVYIANIITDSIDAEKLSAYQDNGKIPLSLSLDNNGIFQVSLAD